MIKNEIAKSEMWKKMKERDVRGDERKWKERECKRMKVRWKRKEKNNERERKRIEK